ncbi:MAG: sterol desaturase family protein [Leptolyngbyaceae cyanobacterium bins.59]|nr:sterol desaturase family protein [Leptolyngbyaceae cyanobacterium bins.59]
MAIEVLKGFILLVLIFVPLERLLSLHQQPVLRPAWQTDTCYFFTGYFIGRAAGAAVATVLLVQLDTWLQLPFRETIAQQPVWLQAIEAIFVADLGYYIAHRLLHTVPWLWRFHAVHHSVREMDWLATVRVHPVDQVFTKLFQLVPLYLLGFSTQTFAVYVIVSATIAFFIHANLRLDLGALTWIIATPRFHHWHHYNHPDVYNKNLAAQLPIIDWIFGTFYLPKGRNPNQYGIADPVPQGYLGQLLYPFRSKRIQSKKHHAT